MKIKISVLQSLVEKSLSTKYSADDAKAISDAIIFGELSGKTSHGIVRLIKGNSSMLAQKPTGKPELISKTKLSKMIIGNGNPAILIGAIGTMEVIKIAKEFGFGIIGTKKTSSTSGCLSYYLEQIAKNDLIGLIMARSPRCVAPFNSIEPLLGTNPIGFAVPSENKPIIFDMGTSAISFGALLKADAVGEKLPVGVAINKEGKTTSDPKEAINGAILGFDKSYKSSGLSMMVELLSGVLPGAGFLDQNEDDGWGNIFVAISPGLLQDVNEFKKKTKLFIERLHNAKTKNGEKVRVSGENTLATRDKNLEIGEIDVPDELIEMINDYIEEHRTPGLS